MRDTFAAHLYELASHDPRIIFITGDLGFGVFETFAEAFPDQYLNVGIAEQNMVAVGTGLALEGNVVFVYSIGNFPVLRCLEQIRNDAAYHDANLNVVSIGGGFSYGPLGMSHHATEDLAVMRAMPTVTTLVPGTLSDVADSVDLAVQSQGVCYLRLDKSRGEETPDAQPFSAGAWRVMRQGSDVTLVACGGVLGEAQKAADVLHEQGVSARVVDAVTLAPIGFEAVISALGPVGTVITVEEHVVRGGLAGLVGEAIATTGHPARLLPVGLTGGFVSAVGSQSYLRQQCGLDAASLVDTASKALKLFQPDV